MTDEPDHREQRKLKEGLWESYVDNDDINSLLALSNQISEAQKTLHKPSSIDEKKRDLHRRAIDLLHEYGVSRDRCISENDKEGLLFLYHRAVTVWALMASETGLLLPDIMDLPVGELQNPETAQLALRSIFEIPDFSLLATHRKAIDPVPVLFPRWLFEQLKDAVQALNKGETLPMLVPRRSGREEPWTWDMMRIRALEFVEFYVGQGINIGIARARVAAAMKNVTTDTIKKWRKECASNFPELPHKLSEARAAGQLYAKIIDDPEYGRRVGDVIAASTYAVYENLRDHPVSLFGEEYFAKFGHRHVGGAP